MDIKCLKIHTLQLAINDYQATEMGSLKKHKESVLEVKEADQDVGLVLHP